MNEIKIFKFLMKKNKNVELRCFNKNEWNKIIVTSNFDWETNESKKESLFIIKSFYSQY